mgnify:CR=1 FL=1
MNDFFERILTFVREGLNSSEQARAVIQFFSDNPILLMAVILVTGTLTCYFGYRFFRLVISLCGCAVGIILGYLINTLLHKIFNSIDVRITVGIMIVLGIIGLVTAFKLVKTGIFISCTYLTYKFIAPLFAGIISAFIAEKMGVTVSITVVCLICGVLMGLLSLAMTKVALMVCSAIGGGYLMAEYIMLIAISTGLFKTIEQKPVTVITLIMAAVFAATGLTAQIKVTAKHRS